MQVHFGVELLAAEWSSSVACIGTFDGVHLGHQEVIRTAVAQAHQKESPCVLVTFDRHPAHILAPARCPKPIASLSSNIAAFERLGVAVAVVMPFDYALSQTSAEDFLQKILMDRIKAHAIVVGHDFAFGHNRVGTADWLRERIETTVVPPFEVDDCRVSSSEVRREVAAGKVEEAARLLGRPFEIPGVIVSGQKLGRRLGFPTANLARSFDQVLPAHGIYSGELVCAFGRFRAAVSIGTRPAVGGGNVTIEAYLLDYPGDPLYGMPVTLELHSRVREERDFDSLEALKAQIALDVEAIRRR
ncbi:MAG TPA: bifunctional riboflavin kinase/FAD synthetase [Fimbriimonadaceae bacterium]|nr:bifunctional riboflavin kinase/FAD synthetase [Fimbriimonadaceae bacterium]